MTTSPPPPPPSVRALSCTHCGGTIALRAAGSTVSLICEHCGTTLDATDPQLRIIAQANEAMRRPEIPLGTRGMLRGMTWEVVGYLERSDGGDGWSEYLLFNPYQGYAFLLDDGRRFSLGFLLDRLPAYTWGEMELDGEGYKRFGSSYATWVKFVVGEFYWRVAVDERVRVSDYVRPGAMISCEENDSERTWSQLSMLEWGEAETAFGLGRRRREWSTPSPHEASPYRDRLYESAIIGLIAAFTLIIIAIMGGGSTRVASADMQVSLDAATHSEVIRNIELPGRNSALTLSARADQLDNSWVDIDYSLVNRRTQENFDASALAEHYSGSDSDGAWSEGDSSPSIKLSSIPPGSYDLLVELGAHRWVPATSSTFAPRGFATGAPQIPVTITVDRGGMFGGNVLLGLILLLLWPAVLLFLHYSFEQRRLMILTEDDDE
ncbi:MAG: hypothetical protein JWN66_1048 [Sphingomonas bacterium]|uniref:DUF4178 domain-containing protein n=1 Tax=Sphingomonas bacterium TaxID=1895847 RepID=UPI002629CF29|nr:DUF4178 domain-containing protein [Sphingomonas bacterium]MDB5703932.1 hypothetical protein [Sphingomonas bacterium]